MVVEVILIGVVTYRLNSPAPKALDITEAEWAVTRVLTDPVDGYGISAIAQISCNDGRDFVIKKGSEFRCDAIVDGAARRITVVFQDDGGTYAVDRPR